MPEQIFFTSDHHFGHTNIIRYSRRPFENVEEMNETLIANWNAVVGAHDIVYHLGDIFITPAAVAKELRRRLNGRICLIRGNHDKVTESMRDSFEWIKDIYDMKVPDPDAEDGRRRLVLCHYAMRVWNKSHRGAWHLYGHSHGTLPDDSNSLSFDAGVDCHAYKPLSYAEVKAIMAGKQFVPVDHHGAEE